MRIHAHAHGPSRVNRSPKRQAQLVRLADRLTGLEVNLRNTYYKKKKIGRIIFNR